MIQVLLCPATQGIFKSGNMSAPWKVRCTWLYCKVGNEAVKGQTMNWMLPCTAGLQTKDKPSIYLSHFPPWKIDSGGLQQDLSDRSEEFNPGRSQCIKGTDETLIHLNLKAMNKTLSITFRPTCYLELKKNSKYLRHRHSEAGLIHQNPPTTGDMIVTVHFIFSCLKSLLTDWHNEFLRGTMQDFYLYATFLPSE